MGSDAVAFEAFTTGRGLSRTGIMETMRASYSWGIRGAALPPGESTNRVRLGWFLLRLFLFSWAG